MAGEDPDYVSEAHNLPCCARDLHPCLGSVETHHAGVRGLGQRSHDDTVIPLCTLHHRAWHDAQPPFRGWDKFRRREWADAKILETQKALRDAK